MVMKRERERERERERGRGGERGGGIVLISLSFCQLFFVSCLNTIPILGLSCHSMYYFNLFFSIIILSE